MNPAAVGSSTLIYVARQPIVDAQGRVFGYELLYRGAPHETTCQVETNLASARVITSALLDLGLQTLTAGRLAFLNVTEALLVDGLDALVGPGDVVLELLETIDSTPEVIEACRDLRAKGYRLALDDFVPGSPADLLLPYASFVKVDMLATPAREAAALCASLQPRGVTMIAEKIETRDSLAVAQDAGYTLFQGFFFCRPTIAAGTAIPAQQRTYLRLFAALNTPDLTLTELENLVKQDVSLSVRVLRFVNSMAVPVRTEVRTIRQALVLVGMEPIRKWASVWCLAGLNTGAAPELSTIALVRARSCEILGERLHDIDASELFLVGLCSLLDVMLSRSMAQVLDGLTLSHTAAAALLGERNRLRAVLDVVVAYERGAWDDATAAAARADVTSKVLPAAYTNALQWARQVAETLN